MNAEKKDKSLENLFEKYIEESPSPNRLVLESAEKELAGDFVCTEVTRKKENFLTRLFKSKRNFRIAVSVGLSFCVCLAVCLGLLFSKNIKTDVQKVLQSSQVVQNTSSVSVQGKDFLGFVNEEELNDYREYCLSEDSPYYDEYEDETIFYYVNYKDFDVNIELYVGVDWFVFDELLGFTEFEDAFEYDGIELLIELDLENSATYAFINQGLYQYYFMLNIADDDLIVSILEHVILSL